MAYKILIVEDEQSLIRALNEKLEQEGFEVIDALNGEEGLEKALHEHPDLILLDIVMPRMDGITMLKELRKDEWGKNVPVLLLTNLTDAAKTAEAVENKVVGYLVKTDWKIEDVVDKIRETLQV